MMMMKMMRIYMAYDIWRIHAAGAETRCTSTTGLNSFKKLQKDGLTPYSLCNSCQHERRRGRGHCCKFCTAFASTCRKHRSGRRRSSWYGRCARSTSCPSWSCIRRRLRSRW